MIRILVNIFIDIIVYSLRISKIMYLMYLEYLFYLLFIEAFDVE